MSTFGKMMASMRKYICIMIALLLVWMKSQAETLPTTLDKDAQMSILVASPSSNEVYTYYGHAGFRVVDPKQGLDVTFNYGIFSFSDDFLYRFVKGETDYIVLPQYTEHYMSEYLGRGSNVEELVLSLDSVEQSRVWAYLLDNIRPEKRAYRYQFFVDNCSTRPLYIVELAVGGLHYANIDAKPLSWRDEINELEGASPWLVFGTDLALGSPTDGIMSFRERSFSPRWLKTLLSNAQKRDGSAVLLRTELHQPNIELTEVELSRPLFSPLVLFLLVLLCALFLYGYKLLYQGVQVARVWDGGLFALAGVSGLLLFYISIFSEHLFVNPNYNLWVLHPFHLLVVFGCIPSKYARDWVICYHFANFVALCLFLLAASFLPQHFNIALYPIALCLGIVSLARVVEHRRCRFNG